MTTLPPIQPRPILCKTPTTNNSQSSSSSSVFLIHSSSTQPSNVINTNFYSTNNDQTNNNNNNTSQILPPPSSMPSTPLSSYEEFVKRLREFHRCRQTTFRYLPTIAGQVVDLQALYTTVVGHGGWDKVNDRQLWSIVANNFGIDSTCLNGTQALKNIYIRYLYAFEKISNGESIDSRDDDDEDAKRRNVSHLQRVPQSYNQTQHIVSDSLRAQYGLFRDFVNRNEYEKIELALLCGFPNELTFTLNTLLLLSSTTNNSITFQLYKCPRLLDILLRHIGLFLSNDPTIHDHHLKSLYDNIWSKHINYQMEQFWLEYCSSDILKQLLNIEKKSNLKSSLYNNFNLNSNENQQQQELRIEQILMIIRNFSFDRSNAIYLLDTIRPSSSITYIFLLLISYCEKKIELQKYAYDIWTNLASYMHLRSVGNDEGHFIRQLLSFMLNGDDDDKQQDRLKIIRALEIIANLAHAGNDNEIYLIDFIDVIIQRLIHVSDILILVHTLECLYQLSELGKFLYIRLTLRGYRGVHVDPFHSLLFDTTSKALAWDQYRYLVLCEQSCNAILKVQSSTPIITTLIDLLTIEARSFSSQTIKTIKIVEMSTGPVLLPSYHQPPSIQQTLNAPQSVVVISTGQQQQPQPQLQQQQQTYAIENTEINKSYYSNNNKLIIQQHSKPITVANVITSGNLLAVATPSTQNLSTTPIIVANTNAQSNQILDKKRKHDSISETIAAVVNGTSSSPSPSSTPPPPKRARPSRPRTTPTKNAVIIAPTPPPVTPSRIMPSLSIEDDTSSMESNSTSNSIHSTMADLLDRCSSPPPPPSSLIKNSFEDDIRLCLNDLCHRVALSLDESLPSTSIIYNSIPSPVFKRKIDEQSLLNKRTTKPITPVEEQTPKKKRNRPSAKKSLIEVATSTPKKEEPIEHEIQDIKPNISTINSSDYICEWDNCRKSFPTARSVFHHACSAHIKYSPEYVCLWNGCDRIKRQKWALISHIQERHCSEIAFRQAKQKLTNPILPTNSNTATISTTSNGPTATTTTATGTVGYAPDAAWLAVRRHMQISSFDDLLIKTKEGPLTKSIRLTAALILRNIARHSSIGKQNLRQYEQHLANLALESSEASTILSSCLFELYN
ncbi:unnamed protein product [Adineta steineri]|uniref:ARID domain-containing protein n=1 Tax=Adineta steineri TaxID=433720 RepID=A0A815X7G4_9BILA|nr:unnamed protein product [Adineta steineri]CAF1553312.1 unnamed protein product [Adineta steineri]